MFEVVIVPFKNINLVKKDDINFVIQTKLPRDLVEYKKSYGLLSPKARNGALLTFVASDSKEMYKKLF